MQRFAVLLLLLLALSGPAVVDAQPVTRGLTGCWHFDEGSGQTIADCSGNFRTLNPGADPLWQSAGSGNCFLNACAGTSSAADLYFTTNATMAQLGSASAFSFTFWFKASQAGPGASDIFGLPKLVGDASLYLGIFWGSIAGGPNTIHAYNWDIAEDIASWSAGYTTGSLIHIAWVHGANTLRLYINGTQVASTTSNNTDGAAGTIEAFGGASTLSACTTLCAIDEWYTYNVELTPAEVATLAGVAPTGGGVRRRSVMFE